MPAQFEDVRLECLVGDIARQPDIDAVVNAANAALQPGAGVAGAIHRAAGPGLEQECRPLAPIRPGQAVITGAHNLPNRFVIHCLGPVYGVDRPEAELLASCYPEARRVARDRGPFVRVPALITGVFGYPFEAAARVAIATVSAEAAPPLALVRFVLFRPADRDVYARLLGDLPRG